MRARFASFPAVLGLLLGALWAAPMAGCSDRGRTLQAYPDELAGVGIVVQETGDAHVISKLVPGGPASDAGLREGDHIVAIDGVATDGKALANVVDALRGRAGSDVAVTVDGGPSGRTVVHLVRRSLARNGHEYKAQ